MASFVPGQKEQIPIFSDIDNEYLYFCNLKNLMRK